MSALEARAALRTCLRAETCDIVASVFDPISARIAASLGYRSGILAGSIASLSVLGAPDIVLLTLSELVEQARRICRAAPGMPLIVDADHGYGNALNVRRTIEDLEAAGVAAITVEDTDLPAPAESHGPAGLIPLEAGIGKIEAALHARRDDSLVIVARTSAVSLTNVQDAVRRCRAYAEAGADAVFLSGPARRIDVETVADAVHCPIILSARPSDMDAPHEHGVRLILGGHGPARMSIVALYESMVVEAKQRGISDAVDRSGDANDLLRQLTLGDEYADWRRRFVR